jgi:hypothetical protein
MRKVYVLDLSEEEKAQLESLTKKGKTSARKLNRRARVLLLANQGETDKAIAKRLWEWAPQLSSASARGLLLRVGWSKPSTNAPVPEGSVSLWASRKLTSWHWLVAIRRRARNTGRCSSWPTRSSSLRWWIA